MIFTPGRFEGIPAAEYHAVTVDGVPVLGSTRVRDMSGDSTVAHMLAKHAKPPTPAMRKGSRNHSAILEPANFPRDFHVDPAGQCMALKKDGERCSNAAKPFSELCGTHKGVDGTDAYKAAHPGVEIITADEYAEAIATAAAVRARIARLDPPFNRILDAGVREVSYFCWASLADTAPGYVLHMEHRPGAIAVKARLDLEYEASLYDLKGTAQGISDHAWQRHMAQMDLQIQAGMYTDIVRCVTGKLLPWGWLAHESDLPCMVRVHQATLEDLELGRLAFAVALERWRAWIVDGNDQYGWPTDAAPIGLPSWKLPAWERDDDE